MTDIQPRVLIEDWLPVAELGIESRRERAVSTTLPPLNRLHVWWARRPVVASAAVVLGGLLPAWSPKLAEEFSDEKQLQSVSAYRSWLLYLAGIWGDPIAGRKAIDAAKLTGIKLEGNGYGYRMAYRNAPDRLNIDLLHRVLIHTWGELPIVADPTAGGGSIPFTAVRLGLPAFANDLNPIAVSVLKAGVQIPAEHGSELTPTVRKWGEELSRRIERSLRPYFPRQNGESINAYIWANAVACPRTGRLVPLMPDKWLRKAPGKEVAVQFVLEEDGHPLNEPRFKVVIGKSVDIKDAATGTVSGGNGISPYDNLVIDGSYIKAEAQAGRMTQVLYALSVRRPNGDREFRAPTDADLAALSAAERRLGKVRTTWEAAGFLPTEEIPEESNYERGHRMYGMTLWADMFTLRQLLVHGSFVQEFSGIAAEVAQELDSEMAQAVLVQLAMMQGKALNWNARSCSWNIQKQGMRSVFDKHNFAFKWTFAEFEGASALFPWTLHVVDNFDDIAQLIRNTGAASILGEADDLPRRVTVTQGSAADLAGVPDGSFAYICMDPPYYDNVMYAELSDFFYVWEKHTLGLVLPEFFKAELTDKDNEAVANPARFAATGRRKNELATLDYETKMTAIFAESRRTLRDDGVLSVMFTHKRAEAWDTLGMGLLQGGFTIETSWPVNTEAEHSLHQKNVNSAASTIMLVCRKRPVRTDGSTTFLEDIEGEIREAAREAVTRFEGDGINGVDLLLSTYGPTLSVISQHWPVYSSTPDADGREQLLRPEQALDLAREEVVRLRRTRLIGKAAQIDDLTDFVLMAWDIFAAREFPFDTARLLALAVGGLEVDDLVRAKVLSKKTGTVSLLAPADRVRHGADSHLPGVRPEASKFDHMVDAVDTVLYVAEHDGSAAAKRLLDQHGFVNDESFLATVQGLVNAIPRSKIKGDWVVPEAGLLDMLVTAYLPPVTLPPDEPMAAPEAEQGAFDLG